MSTDKRYSISINIIHGKEFQALTTSEVTGATMEEALSKLPLKVAEIMRKEHEILEMELREMVHGKDDDVPF